MKKMNKYLRRASWAGWQRPILAQMVNVFRVDDIAIELFWIRAR
jgi:hypothetical protein